MKLPIDMSDAIADNDLSYVVAGPHSIVAVDARGNQWPVTWANIQTCIDHGGVPPSFSNLDIPERIPYLKEAFPKIWNYDQDQIPDSMGADKLFEIVAEIRGDGSDTMKTHDSVRVIKIDAADPDAMRLQRTNISLPYDPREPMPPLQQYETADNFIGVQLAPTSIKAKRSAFKPRVFADDIDMDIHAHTAPPLVAPNVLRKHVRRIFPSQRRVQWTLNGSNFTQLESPLKLIRYLCALGFSPTNLQPTGTLLTARHNISFLAEYSGALFGFFSSKVNQYHCWDCVMFTDSSEKKYRPYSTPGFHLSRFYKADQYEYTPQSISMGGFNYIGSRGVPAPLDNMAKMAAMTATVTRNHDTRPMRYGLQIRYRWKQVMNLVESTMGQDYLSDYEWDCYTIPGPALIHKIKWKEMQALRFTADAMEVIHNKIDDWSKQFQEVQSVYCHFESTMNGEDYFGEDNFNDNTPFNAQILMADTVAPLKQAEIMASFFMELPALIEKVVEDDPNGCK